MRQRLNHGDPIPALDGIRAIAILLVIPHNTDIYTSSPGIFWPLAVAAHVGWIGVQLFFVLSGFLITGNLLDRRGSQHYFRNFYIRRALRIMPLYYLALIVGLLVIPALFQLPPKPQSAKLGQAALWVFMNNWVQGYRGGVEGFSHFWSLAVEEQFYLIWPFVVLVWQRARLAIVCVVLIVLAMLSRVLLLKFNAPEVTTYLFTICRMDALAAGALGALVIRSNWEATWAAAHARWLYLVALFLLMGGALVTHVYYMYGMKTLTLGYPLLALAFTIIIVASVINHQRTPASWLNRLLSLRPLRAIGRYSYGMYVLHLPIALAIAAPVHRLLAPAGPGEAVLYPLTVVLLSIGAGALSYTLVERHFLRLKSQLAPESRSLQPNCAAGTPLRP